MTDKPQKEVKQPSAEDFAQKYQELCKETGFTIIPSMAWVARDDGTWSTKVNLTVGQLPQEKE